MTGHGAKFARKKEEAVAALLSQRNVEEAARVVGIDAKTLLRWMKEPEFDAAYRVAPGTPASRACRRGTGPRRGPVAGRLL
jgi:transposase-like protein